MKKITLFIVLFSTTVFCQQPFNVDGFIYRVTSANTVEVFSYIDTSKDVIIPSVINANGTTYSVSSIGNGAFNGKSLTSVVIPNSVTSIGASAFINNFLTSVKIPNSVTNIEGAVFRNNPITGVVSESSLPSTILSDVFDNRDTITLYIPEGTATVYNTAGWTNFKDTNEVIVANIFIIDEIVYSILPTSDIIGKVKTIDYLGSNSSVSIPSIVENEVFYNVSVIGDRSFFSNQLTSVTIPGSVTSIEDLAFLDNAISNITLPNSITTIGSSAFRRNALTSVEIPTNVTVIEAFTFAENALTSVIIPEAVTSLGQGAFRDNSLTSITIPRNVTSIGETAFSINLITDVISVSLTPAFLPSNTFDDKSNINLVIPEGTTSIYTNENWIDFRLTIEDPTLSTNTPTFLEDNISIDNYTNPDYITISTTNAIEVKGVDIYGISGAKILSSSKSQIATASLAHGIYILQVITNKGNYTRKFAK